MLEPAPACSQHCLGVVRHCRAGWVSAAQFKLGLQIQACGLGKGTSSAACSNLPACAQYGQARVLGRTLLPACSNVTYLVDGVTTGQHADGFHAVKKVLKTLQ